MKKLLVILLLLPFLAVSQTNYYFAAASASPAGNDGNACTILAPCLSAARMNGLSLQHGDTIYIQTGDTIIGGVKMLTSGTSASKGQIVINSYGSTGAAPVITGLSYVTGWVASATAHVYEAYFPSALSGGLNVLKFNGADQPMGQFPARNNGNGGYNNITAATLTTVTDASNTYSSGVIGGWLCVRSTNFNQDVRTITGYSAHQFTTSGGNFSATPAVGYGYFFENCLPALTQNGDWMYNSGSDSIFMYMTGLPSSNTIQASNVDTLLTSGANYLTVLNIDFEGANQITVAFTQALTTYDTINNCQMNYSGFYHIGQNTNQVEYASFSYDKMTYSHCTAIQFQCSGTCGEIQNSTIQYDSVEYSGRWQGMGGVPSGVPSNQSGGGSAIATFSYGCKIHNNYLHWMGGSGTTTFGTTVGNAWRYNFIDSASQNYCDQGGLYINTGGAGFDTCEYNIVVSSYGGYLGTTMTVPSLAHGIYLDNGTTGWTVRYNTTAYNSGSGIYLHYTGKSCSSLCNVIDSNTFYGNTTEAVMIADGGGNDSTSFTKFNGNICVSPDSAALVMSYYLASFGAISITNQFDSNFYTRPTRDFTTFKNTGGGGSLLTLAAWQSFSNQDAHSITSNISGIYPIPGNQMFLHYNATANPVVKQIRGPQYDVHGNVYYNTMTIPAYSSIVGMIRLTTTPIQGPVTIKGTYPVY